MAAVSLKKRYRSEFIANISHELKTPLTSIKGFLETLIEGGVRDPEKQRSFLQIMQEDANRLSRLIQDLLEISRLEGHKKALKKEVVSLRRRAGCFRGLSAGVGKKINPCGQSRGECDGAGGP